MRPFALIFTALALFAALPVLAAGTVEERLEKLDALAAGERFEEAVDVALKLLEEALKSSSPPTEPLLRANEAMRRIITLRQDHGGELRLATVELARRVVELQEKLLGPSPALVRSLYDLADMAYARGELERTEVLVRRSLAICEEVCGPADLARSLYGMAGTYFVLGDYAAALPYARRSLELEEAQKGSEHPDVARLLDLLASLMIRVGSLEEALPLQERALEIREKALGARHPLVIESVNNIAYLRWKLGELEEALRLFKDALARSQDGEASLLSLYNNIGRVYLELGEAAAGLRYLEEAHRIARSPSPDDRPYLRAVVLHSLARAHSELGHFETARAFFERSLEIQYELSGERHPRLAETLGSYALLLRQEDPSAALDAALRAEKVSRDHLRLTIAQLAERQALGYAAVRFSGLNLALSLCVAPSPPAGAVLRTWDALLRSRALVLDEIAGRHRALARSRDPELGRLWQELLAARQELANLYVRTPGDVGTEELARAESETNRLEESLARRSVAFRAERRGRRAGWREVAAALPEDSALVAYVLYDRVELDEPKSPATPSLPPTPSYLAFVLRSGGTPIAVDLGPASTVEARVRHWRDEVTRYSEARYRRAGEALREAVWDPIAAETGGVRRVFVVPDGELHLVHLEALPVGRTSYLVERPPILHHLSTERDVVTLRADPSDVPRRSTEEAPGLLALGGADFDADFDTLRRSSRGEERVAAASPSTFRGSRSGCSAFRSARFLPLAATAREAEDVTAVYERSRQSPADVLLGSAATETAFKQLAPRHRLLHVATHGFFLGEGCPSALRRERVSGPGENPLLLSGLVLAGANHRQDAGDDEDDGILTAEEIAALDLSGVEWAVLSACDTGLGDVRVGEGVFGLRRAFRLAGARTLIMSLWKIDDESTRRFMRALYEARLLRGLGTAEAMRAASLEILRERRGKGQSTHPYYWGGFVAEGAWD